MLAPREGVGGKQHEERRQFGEDEHPDGQIAGRIGMQFVTVGGGGESSAHVGAKAGEYPSSFVEY
ncbi:MAG: hypothetical protein N2690_03085 [Rhodocyclaceae bacterium]|nr:hypothetical protein [Rhodocyclaceae bacterium]